VKSSFYLANKKRDLALVADRPVINGYGYVIELLLSRIVGVGGTV
jgi:hypothetical protein